MSDSRSCDVCRMARVRLDRATMNPVSDVTHYSLRLDLAARQENGVRINRTQVGRGGIDLCSECWERVSKHRMNGRKSHRRATA